MLRQRSSHARPVTDTLLVGMHGAGDDDVSRRVGHDVEGGEDGNAGREQSREVSGESGKRNLLEELAENRHPKLDGVDDRPHLEARALSPVDHGQGNDPPENWQADQRIRDEVRQVHEQLGRRGQLAPERGEHLREDRDDEDEHGNRNEDGDDANRDRIGHRGLDLAAQQHIRLHRGRDLEHCRVEEAAHLSGPDHADHQRRERLLLLHGDRKRIPPLDVGRHLAENPSQRGVRRLLAQDRQAAEDRQPRGQHRRELATEDREVLGLHSGLQQLHIPVHAGLAHGLDSDRRHAEVAYPRQRIGLAHRGQLLLNEPAGSGAGLDDVFSLRHCRSSPAAGGVLRRPSTSPEQFRR
ncbi:unannotated protein [freshwater metagenome]|uniref:Unannotated protein n=1 Tax=freshwater metagenome TaxID=449393 RepID=A0A6J7ESY8_9ZZZZ